MRAKEGVRIHGLTPQIMWALQICDSVSKEHTKREIMVTSISDGTHSRGSRHPYGFAADLRLSSWYDKGTPEDRKLHRAFTKELGPDFDVVLESDHFHIEWDPQAPI